MKTLLATAAVIAMTGTSAFADPTGETVPTTPTAAEYEAQIAQLQTDLSNKESQLFVSNNIKNYYQSNAQSLSAQLTTAKAALAEAEEHIEVNDIFNGTLLNHNFKDTAIDLSQKNNALENDIHFTDLRLQVAAKKNFRFGNVLQATKDAGTYRDDSYDIGEITTGMTYGSPQSNKWSDVNDITFSGKYHNFTIDTDLKLYKSASNMAEFTSVINEVKDVIYKEGYKDGFNDGYEVGYVDGYRQSAIDIRAAM